MKKLILSTTMTAMIAMSTLAQVATTVDEWTFNSDANFKVSDQGTNLQGKWSDNEQNVSQPAGDNVFILAPTNSFFSGQIPLSGAIDTATYEVVRVTLDYTAINFSTNASLNSKLQIRLWDNDGGDAEWIGLTVMDNFGTDKIVGRLETSTPLGPVNANAGRLVNSLGPDSTARTIIMELDFPNNEVRISSPQWQWSSLGGTEQPATYTNSVDLSGFGEIDDIQTAFANSSLGDQITIDNLLVEKIDLDAVPDSITIIEQWDYTDNSLFGTNGNYMQFVNSNGNLDEWSPVNTYTVNRDAGFSGNTMTNLNIFSGNADTITMSMRVNSWDFTRSGGNGSWGARLWDTSNNQVMYLRFGDELQGGTNTKTRLYGAVYNGTAGGVFTQGGRLTDDNFGSRPVTVGLTLNFTNETYTFWLGNPDTDDGSNWENRYASYTGSVLGLGSITVDRLAWAWQGVNDTPATNAPNGDFVELDRITLASEAAGVETIHEEWNYTGNSLLGVNSNQMGFVNSGGNLDDASDNGKDETYTVNRDAGFSGNTVLSNMMVSASTAESITIDMDFASWDLSSSGSNGYWGLRLKDSTNATLIDLRFNVNSSGYMQTTIRDVVGTDIIRNDGSTNTIATGGVISFNQVSSVPATLSFTLNMWSNTYSFAGTTFDNEFAAQSTGTIPGLAGVEIDRLQWVWWEVNDTPATPAPDGDFVELDRISITAKNLVLSPGNYAAWLLNYPGLGSLTNKTDNPDGDILNNLYEYALGGNPDDGNDTGIGSTLATGANYLEYIHVQRNDDATLVYSLATDDDLVNAPDWADENYVVIGTNTNYGVMNFDAVTNRIPTDVEPVQFIKLNVQ